MQFSGRTLNLVFNSLYNREDMKEQELSVIEDCYSVSYENPNQPKEELLKIFYENPTPEF